MAQSPLNQNTQSHPLRLLVVGAGAIGTFVGGSLAGSGYQVTFLERPEVADVLRKRGLRLTLEDGKELEIHPQVSGSILEALDQGPFDAGIFALKAYDTSSFLEGLATGLAGSRYSLADLPVILCLQNGVDNEQTLRSVLGKEKVIAGSITSAVGRRDAGDIVLERRRGVGIAGGQPLSERLAAALTQAGLPAKVYADGLSMKWSKMLTNLLAAGQSAVLGMTPAEIYAHPGLYRLEIAQQKETLAVMAAQGLKPINLPGAPASLIAMAVQLPLSISRPLVAKVVGGGRGNKMPAFYLDLRAGRKQNEIVFLNGAVVRYGEQYGIPTPVNRFLTETVMAMVEDRLPMTEYDHQPEKLILAISRALS